MGNLANLGSYGAFTTRAGAAGGVDKLIKIIESEAVRKSAPKIAAAGIAVGAALATGVPKLYRVGSDKLARHKMQRAAAAEAAKEELRNLAEDAEPDPSPSL